MKAPPSSMQTTWPPDIPSHWDVKPLGRIFKIINGSTPKSGEANYWDGSIAWATPDDLGDLRGDTLQSTRRTITEEGYRSCGTSLSPAGSLVLSTRAPIGYVAIAGVPLCTNQGCRTLVPGNAESERFLYYQLVAARPELESWGQGSTFRELSRDRLAALHFAVPPLEEQRAIAAFLDRETTRIDALIEKKRRQIELLHEKRAALTSHTVTKGLDPNAPMKDSGIDWLGDIPKHWQTPPLYARFSVELGKMLDAKQITGQYFLPYVRNVDVQWDNVNVAELPEMDIAPDEYTRYTLKEGDLLVCEGGEVGRTAIWRGELPVCAFQKAIHRLRPLSSRDLPRFFYYVMRAAASTGVFVAHGNPNTIPHLTAEKLRVYRFAFPPTTEQRAIVGFLDRESGKIDMLVEKVSLSIDQLREYRTALISAAVTGKIDVRKEVA